MDSKKLQALKQAAENTIAKGEAFEPNLKLMHDVQVYQAELEAQFNELLKTEKNLEDSKARLENIIDVIPAAILLIDKLENITHINELGLDVFGLQTFKVINKNLLSIFGEKEKTQIMSWLLDVNQTAIDIELKPSCWYRITQSRFSDTERLICLTDISQEKIARDFLENENNIEDHKSKIKDSFIASISHELRTPLNGIMGIVQLLQLETVKPKHSQLLGQGLNSLKLLLSLIDDLLDYTKIQRGELIFENTVVDLEKLGQQTIENIQFKLEQQTNTVSINNLIKSTLYLADKDRIQKVLLNILGNINKTISNSHIELVLTQSNMDSVVQSRLVTISIQIEGGGINHSKLKQLLDGYSSTIDKNSSQFRGLGLDITRLVISKLNGSIDVNDTEILVNLPLDLATDIDIVEPEPFEANRDINLTEKLIYIVDDNPINLEILNRMLEFTRANVKRFRNAHELIDAFHQQPPDIILTDIQMPEMDGVELAKLLRRDHFDGPIIAVTANAYQEDKDHYISSGFDYVLVKPIEISDLFRVLESYLLRLKDF